MSKENIKKELGREKDFALIDTHRLTPKKDGGEYVDGNVVLSEPVEHMETHGNLRVRDETLNEIKMLIDDREQIRKLYQKVENQMLAYKRRTDHLSNFTLEWLKMQSIEFKKELTGRDKLIKKAIKEHSKIDPLTKAAMGVKGIGQITVAYMLIYIDLEKARHASSLWAYCGYDKPSHARYEKGVAGGGNKTLRTALFTMAYSMMKTRGDYRYIYDRVKSRLEVSEKITKSRNTQGKLIECMWKDTKLCHRHGAALRAMIKHFLADWWFVGRTLVGLPTAPGYAEAILGKDGHKTIAPEERGWKYDN